jgi:hypothetical protein
VPFLSRGDLIPRSADAARLGRTVLLSAQTGDLEGFSEPENEREGVIDGAWLVGRKATLRRAQPLWINHGCLLDQDVGVARADANRRPEASGPRARGCRRDQDGAEPQELVGLPRPRTPRPALLMGPRNSRSR